MDITNRILKDTGLSENWKMQLICSHHHTNVLVYKIFDNEQKELILKIEAGSSQKLLREIDFINSHNMLDIYPKIYFSGSIDDIHYYIMESLLNYQNVLDIYINNQLNDHHINAMLNLLKSIASETTIERLDDIFKTFYEDRISKRLKLLKRTLLFEVMTYKRIVINGKEYRNLPYLLDDTIKAAGKRVFKSASPFPGDLHFEHIFITPKNNIKIIDPNGAPYLPLAYDLGKLLHSLHGDYHSFNRFEFSLLRQKNKFVIKYYRPQNRDDLLNIFNKLVVFHWDHQTLQFAYLSEVFHFASLLALHIDNGKKVIGFYCRAVELANSR